MTESQSRPDQDTSARIASHLANAIAELHGSILASSGIGAAGEDLREARQAIQDLTSRLEAQLAADQEQRRILGDQLSILATSLEHLVSHLQGMSQLMGDLLQRLAEPRTEAPVATPTAAQEPAFRPGGEGLSLALAGVPGFQALMDIQKALSSMPQVAGASVERYQEGDSRILLHLREEVTASQLAGWLRSSTPHNVAVEESKPELSRLLLKVLT